MDSSGKSHGYKSEYKFDKYDKKQSYGSNDHGYKETSQGYGSPGSHGNSSGYKEEPSHEKKKKRKWYQFGGGKKDKKKDSHDKKKYKFEDPMNNKHLKKDQKFFSNFGKKVSKWNDDIGHGAKNLFKKKGHKDSAYSNSTKSTDRHGSYGEGSTRDKHY